MNRLPSFRLLARCCFLAAIVVLASPAVSWPWARLAAPAASPLVGICAAAARRSLGVTALAALPALVAIVLSRRWLCHWVCPVGLVLEQAERLRSSGRAATAKFPRLGHWLALAMLGAAVCGYPLLLWCDPLVLFHAAVTLRHPLSLTSLVACGVLGVVLLVSLIWPRLWCHRLCPLGATQEIAFSAATSIRYRAKRQCRPAPNRANFTMRRGLLAVGLGAGAALACGATWRNRRSGTLRPPGARDEERFTGLCTRCGNCLDACPSRILVPDLDSGLLALLAPRVRFGPDYCLPECTRCGEVCPSGAIGRLAAEEKNRHPIGIPQISASLCLMAQGLDCRECLDGCPCDALEECLDGDAVQPIVHAEKCIGCGACEVLCRAQPEKAIVVKKTAQKP